MSLLPLLFSAWWAELDRPHRLMDQNFGLGLYPDQLIGPSLLNRYPPSIRDRAALDLYYSPLADILRRDEGGSSTITADKDSFNVILDVKQFKPEEITVKLIDRYIVVEAKHQEKRDEHGWISRQFIRKYLLPDQVDIEKVSSNISSDGILSISAPLKQIEQKPNEKTIKIELTGKPAIRPEAGGKINIEKSATEEPQNSEEATIVKNENEINKPEK